MKPPYTHVPSEGPMDAKIIILGESPWINEAEALRPFAGASGNLMKRWWEPMGLKRTEMRLMNLFPYRPPRREIESVPVANLITAIEQVHERIGKLHEPYVIVPMGNYATYALTGKGKVKAVIRKAFGDQGASEADKKAGISSLRGSIYPYKDPRGREIKVIPMIHPAGVLQQPKWEKRSIADWGRVKRESQYQEIRDPGRRHVINPSIEDVARFYETAQAAGGNARMSVDIESWGGRINCVGFALSAWESFTIPGTEEMMPWIKALCEGPTQKVLCNGTYDWYWLNAWGIRLNNYLWDVQSMHHALDAAESHSLDFLASIYCEHYAYWKDEAKDAEEIVKYARNLDALYVYNGLDCCYTWELVEPLEQRLREVGMLEFYFRHYAAMFEPLTLTMRHGMRVDVAMQKSAAKELKKEMGVAHQALNKLAQGELFATETKTALVEVEDKEWQELLPQEFFDSDPVVDWIAKEEPPDKKWIDRDVRKRLIVEKGRKYNLTGVNAGKMTVKVTKVKKDFSKDKLLEFFCGKNEGQLGLPKQFVKRVGQGGYKRSVSLNEASLRKLMYRFTKAVEPGRLLLVFREKKKERDYLRHKWDKDGRVRCEYTMRTKAGRLASSSNPMGTGLNLQNIKR